MLPTILNLHYMNLLNQVHTGLWPACDLLLATTLICVCIHPGGFYNYSDVIWTLYDWLNKFYNFYMVATVDISIVGGTT